MSAIIPESCRQHVDEQTSRFLGFYQEWVGAGCQGNWQGRVIDDDWRFLVKSELDQDNYITAVLYVERKYYCKSRQTKQWAFPNLFGGVSRHPSVWFSEIMRVLMDRIAASQMQAP
jgi:hypothetical protein